MKRYRLSALVGLLIFGMSGNAMATIRFHLDNPPSTPTGNTQAGIYTIGPSGLVLGQPGTVAPVDCSNYAGLPSDLAGSVSCFGFNNVSGAAITSFKFTFSFTPDEGTQLGLTGQTLSCGVDNYLTTFRCPSGELQPDTLYTMLFGGMPPIPDNTDFYFGSDVSLGNLPFAATPNPVPEPPDLGLFGLGLLGIGIAMGWRRRQQRCRSVTA